MGGALAGETQVTEDEKAQAKESREFSIPKKYEPSEQRRSSSVVSSNIGAIDTTAYTQCNELTIALAQPPEPPPLGTLLFEARYQKYEEQLTIHLIGAKRLPVRHHVIDVGDCPHYDVMPCDPKVLVCLLPDEKPVLESYVKQSTWDPNFDETFVFKLNTNEVKEKTLRFSVYDCTRLHKLCPIGHTLFSLKGQDLDGTMAVERAIKPQCQTYGHSRGEISLSLTYNPGTSRLVVGVRQARNILQFEGHAHKEYFVKISRIHLNRKVKTKRTPSTDGDASPIFKHDMSFNIPTEQLSDSCLVLSLMNHGVVRGSTTIGRVVLGPYVFGSGNERSHWGRMIRSPLNTIEQWHSLYL